MKFSLRVGLAILIAMQSGDWIFASGESISPNIVLIVCDDLGYGDLGCYGAKDIKTPAIDQMAHDGVRFTDFSVTAPLCTPSRASMMTGKYPGRVGLATGVLRPDATTGLAHDEITLGDLAKAAGYRTGCIGKWHLGFVDGMLPIEQGFDEYFGVLHNLDHHETSHFEAFGGMPIYRDRSVVARPADPAKMTSLYTDEAVKFIQQHASEKFFLYIGHAMPHLPLAASPAYLGRSKRSLYGDVVEELDASTGKIIEALQGSGIAEKTLVFFTSDNGPERKTDGSSAPLRGTKHTVYEGGVRVPFIALWPQHVLPNRVTDLFAANLDLFPTIANLIGAKTQASGITHDGYDFSSTLLTDAITPLPRQSLYVQYGYNKNRLEAIRVGSWKLHLKEPVELYNLATDLGEQTNVATMFPERVLQLRHEADRIRE